MKKDYQNPLLEFKQFANSDILTISGEDNWVGWDTEEVTDEDSNLVGWDTTNIPQ